MSTHEIPLVEMPTEDVANPGPFLAQTFAEVGPIFRAQVRGREIIYLIGPAANQFILVSHRQHFSHHQGWADLRGLARLLGDGLVTMDGAEHDWHRRMMHPAFTLAYMQRYVPTFVQRMLRHLDRWGDEGIIDISAEIRQMTFGVLAETLAGLGTDSEIQHYQHLFTTLFQLGREGTATAEQLLNIRRKLYTLLQPKIQERRLQPSDDILGMLASARDEADQMLSDAQLIAHINFLVGLGHESTSSLCTWALFLLASHPKHLQRIMQEQTSAFQEQTAQLQSSPETALDTYLHMPLLDLVLKETERMYPPIEGGPRGVLADCEFAGYRIPAGAFVQYSIAATHLLSTVFTNPTAFDPERFQPPREEHKKTPYALVGFGGGPRICIAGHLANVEIKAMLTGILHRYHVESIPDEHPQQVYRGIGAADGGIRLHVQRRKKINDACVTLE